MGHREIDRDGQTERDRENKQTYLLCFLKKERGKEGEREKKKKKKEEGH
jgi:hypothetical protein